MRKVFYPDELEKKQILQGTKVGEDMFLADYLLKQMSLGYKNSNTKFDFPYELKAKGLQRVQFSNDDNGKFHRFWVITKKIESIANEKSSQGFFCLNRIKLGVDTREMEISKNGTIIMRRYKLHFPLMITNPVLWCILEMM